MIGNFGYALFHIEENCPDRRRKNARKKRKSLRGSKLTNHTVAFPFRKLFVYISRKMLTYRSFYVIMNKICKKQRRFASPLL